MIPYYIVQDVDTGETLPGMPTPMLISNGHADAYLKDGIWYMRYGQYQPDDGKSRYVRVRRNPESIEQEQKILETGLP